LLKRALSEPDRLVSDRTGAAESLRPRLFVFWAVRQWQLTATFNGTRVTVEAAKSA
jgi:hypothetical protein